MILQAQWPSLSITAVLYFLYRTFNSKMETGPYFMHPGLVNTHDLFIESVFALMLLIYSLILKAIHPVCKYAVIGPP